MGNENHLLKYTMTYGAYLGIAYSLVVFVLHLAGIIHYPGDKAGMFNTAILTFVMLYFGRRYRDTVHQGEFVYRQAFGFTVLISVFSAFIYAFFSYWYYGVIEPKGIEFVIDRFSESLGTQSALSEQDLNSLIDIYRKTLTPGSMAFMVGFYQAVMGILIGLIVAVFIKSPINYFTGKE